MNKQLHCNIKVYRIFSNHIKGENLIVIRPVLIPEKEILIDSHFGSHLIFLQIF